MKLSMSKAEFSRIITDRLNLGPAILAGKVITEIEFPSRYSGKDDVEIIFDDRHETYVPIKVAAPAHPLTPSVLEEPF